MSRPKLTNTPEELKKLFRDYPRIVSAFRWIEHHQDCLTGSMRVEEYPREDNDGQITIVPMFMVNNNDDYKMLNSLRVERDFAINFMQRNDESQEDEDDDDSDEVHEVGASHLGAKQLSYAKKAAQRKEKAVKAAAESHYSSDEDSAYSNSSTSSHNSGESIRRSPASTNNGIADEDYEEIEYTTGPCEEHFISSGNSPKVLFAMAIGVGPDRETLISAEQEPFLSSHKKSNYKPTASDLKAEVQRRATLKYPEAKPVACRYWPLSKLNKHLTEDYPILDDIDVEFLRRKTNEIKSAGVPGEQDEQLVEEGSSRWIDQKAFLRLYHVLIDEEVKKLFFTRDNVFNRQELDARNSSQRRKTFQEAAADLYNDPNFAPSSYTWGHVHSDFAESIKLAAEDAPTQVTPEKIMEQFNNVRARLSQVSIACFSSFLLEPLQMNYF